MERPVPVGLDGEEAPPKGRPAVGVAGSCADATRAEPARAARAIGAESHGIVWREGGLRVHLWPGGLSGGSGMVNRDTTEVVNRP